MKPDIAILRVLQGLGLSDKESAVYLALLASGTSPASSLSKRTSIVKSTTQFTCQQLVKKGLARVTRRGNLYLFSSEPPDKLLYLVEHRKRALDEQEQNLQAVLGRLQGMMNPLSALPKVHFYEGRNGIAEGYREVLSALAAGDEILTYLNPIDLRDDPFRIEGLLDRFVEDRVAKGVSARVIALPSPQSSAWKARDTKQLRETRVVDGLPFEGSPVEIFIYHDRMYALAVEHDVIFSYIVQNASIASMHRAMFELAWKAAGQ